MSRLQSAQEICSPATRGSEEHVAANIANKLSLFLIRGDKLNKLFISGNNGRMNRNSTN